MTEHNVKEISLEDFENQYQGKGAKPSWQLQIIKDMATGTAIVLSHEDLVCRKKTNTRQRFCSAAAMVFNLKHKSPNKLYKFAHTPNGDIMVACYAREKMAQ